MIRLTQRNLLIYFTNRSRVLLSLLGAFISFGLYLLFLKNNMQSMWSRIPEATKLLDPWLISGTLSVIAITTSFTSLSQIVIDRESNTINDLKLTDAKEWQIQGSYLLTAIIISTVIQLIAFIILQSYFQISDQIISNWNLLPEIIVIALINSVVWTSTNLVITNLFYKQQSLSLISTIIGTAAGFFVGVYLPISLMPNFAQNLIKWTPAPYSAALYRQVLTNKQIKVTFKNLSNQDIIKFKSDMGINVKFNHLLNFQQTSLVLLGFTIVMIVILIILNAYRHQKSAKIAK